MKISLTDPRVRTGIALMLTFFFCKWSVGEMHNVKDKAKVAQMTATMKPVCVGRFLIDVPAEAKVFYRGAFLHGWDIGSDSGETDEQFSARLAGKEAELSEKKNQRGGDSLEAVITVNSNAIHGKIFVFNRTWSYSFEGPGKRVDSTAASAHAHVRIENTSVNFTANYGASRVKELAQVVTQIKPLSEGEIPVDPGFCFGRFMLRDPLSAEQNERVTMFFSLKDHPDFVFALDSAAGLKPSDPLLLRDERIREEYAPFIKSYRRGSRIIGGIPGSELVEGFHESNGTTGYSFEWESIPIQSDVYRPALDLELTTGHPPRAGARPVESSLSDEALLILWDKIASSIRVRPTLPARAPHT